MSETDQAAFRTIEDGDVEDVVALWIKCGLTRPHNDPHKDIAFARQGPNSAVLVGFIGADIVSSVMVGHDGHRGTVYYVSCDPDRQGEGLGRATMQAAQDWLVARGMWKLNLMIRAGNDQVQGFYEALGYECESRTVMSRSLHVPTEPP